MGMVTTRDVLRAKLRRAFDAGRRFAFGENDYDDKDLAADHAFESFTQHEHLVDPHLDVRKP